MLLARFAYSLTLITALAQISSAADFVRVGILGIDNYQGIDYAAQFNNPKAEGDLTGLRVTAVFPVTSDDYPDSATLTQRWLDQMSKLYQKPKDPNDLVPVPEVVKSIDELLARCDVVMMAGLDGRMHLSQATPVLKAGKRLFITRPLAADPKDAIAILKLAAETKTPCWSCSQHRYSTGFIGMRNHPDVGNVLGCDVYGGYDMKAAKADEFIRPLHSLETLYTIMRPGCSTVACTSTPTSEIWTMTWKDGRVATYRGIKQGGVKYSATVFGDKGVSTAGIYGHGIPARGVIQGADGKTFKSDLAAPTNDEYMGYKGLAIEMAKFFNGGPTPVDAAETIEIFAVIQAAEQSKAQGGVAVAVPDLWNSAK